MRILARPGVPEYVQSVTSPYSAAHHIPSGKPRGGRLSCDAQRRASTAPHEAAPGGLGTTGNLGAKPIGQIGLKPASALGLREMTDSDTGEIFTVKQAKDCSLQVVQSAAERRVLRYERKSAAVDALVGLGKSFVSVIGCHVYPISNQQPVEVWAKRGAALPGHFRGLQTCARAWLCPVCAPKIAERRAAEIEAAMATLKAQGGQVLMPTFTVPHGRNDALTDTLALIKKALRSMGQSRKYRDLQTSLGVQGRITATEITHGEVNGWHPHFHELWFFELAGIDVVDLELRLYRMWRAACLKFGLGEPSRKHGVVVQDGSQAAAYVSKLGNKEWSLSDEIAKASSKGGRRASRSAWELLDTILDTDATPGQQKRAQGLFREYAEATKGRQQLAWSPGLKKRYAIAEKDDEELVAEAEEDAILLALICPDDWRAIRKQKAQAHVLNAAQFGSDAVKLVVRHYVSMEGRPPGLGALTTTSFQQVQS